MHIMSLSITQPFTSLEATHMTPWILFILGGYLVGSIPFGWLIGRAKNIEIREHGSKNIGATNVTRVLGKPLGMLCLGLDMVKGAGPVLAAGFTMGVINRATSELTPSEMWLWLAVAFAPVLGHMFSIFLKFQGGKGVATGFGALIAMWPILTLPVLIALVVWYFVLRMTKYVALASMIAVLSLPLGYLISIIPNDGANILESILHGVPPLIATSVLALLIIYKHRGNIVRLRRGKEPKIGGQGRRGDVLHDSPENPG